MPYSSGGDCIYSINRNLLNVLLLDRVAKDLNITLYFQCKVEKILFHNQQGMNTIIATDRSSSPPTSRSADYPFVFGCDGVHSVVREQMMIHGGISCTKQRIEHGYKELTIGSAAWAWRLSSTSQLPSHLAQRQHGAASHAKHGPYVHCLPLHA